MVRASPMPLQPNAITFAVRGDILSTTGYARAARALAEILAEDNRVLGISIHEDPSDRSAGFPGDLVSDAELRQLARCTPLAVIHHTTPHDFWPVPDAINIGLFYWETDAIPRKLAWSEHIASMDAIWAPTQFVANFVRQCGFDGPVRLIPWAQRFDGPTAPPEADGNDIAFDLLPRLGRASETDGGSWQNAALDGVRRSGGDVFLAVQSLAPRKGLPVLINEWHHHVVATPNSHSVLLLKLNFRHAHGIGSDLRRHFVNLLRRYGVPDGDPIRIGLISRLLSDDEMRRLMGRASALVTCSYGEGFGGPIVEAINLATPVIASRHTGITDLLPPDYPLQYASRLVRVPLRDLSDVYPPSSSWFVPEAGALAGAIAAFHAMHPEQRARAVGIARAHAQSFCALPVVRRLVRDAIETLVWR